MIFKSILSMKIVDSCFGKAPVALKDDMTNTFDICTNVYDSYFYVIMALKLLSLLVTSKHFTVESL